MITVLGASGFIGSNIVTKLMRDGKDVYAPKRDEYFADRDLGHIIYCIGMTADFRTKPFETVDAHVCLLKYILETCVFESLTYLSSTRIYIKSKTKKKYLTEEDDIVVNSRDAFDLFTASKITGELLALNSGRENIKIVRLSNVFGADLHSQNFITTIVRDALTNKKVELFTTPDSSKDYISVDDVSGALIKLAYLTKTGIYNLASGKNTSNKDILNELEKLTGAQTSYSPESQKIIFHEISNSKIVKEIKFKPTKSIINSLPEILLAIQNSNHNTNDNLPR